MDFPGYSFAKENIHTSLRTLVLSGVRMNDHQPVIIKMLKDKHPSLEDIEQLKNEYAITKLFNADERIVHTYAFEKYHDIYAMFLENIPLPTLNELLKKERKIDLIAFLEIAVEISKAIGTIHQHYVIHKDITPDNILCDYEHRTIKIIDFSNSETLSREHVVIDNPKTLEGTLAYISPEQTGRMNRGIDYRSDFYSLGVVFYKMLTGQLPFEATDPLKLIHYHIAVVPKSPHEIDPNISEMISKIVMKLLKKTPEERYQNANGLIADLKICLEQLKKKGHIKFFPLGKHDVFNRFQISEKLYGRENEVNILLKTYQKVIQGNFELMLVQGPAGIGKSVLVHEIYKPIAAKNGYFISGKYEKFKHNIPYFALAQAFDGLVNQILTQNENDVALFRHQILNAVEKNGQVLINIIPNLVKIIGKQPPVIELGMVESHNRLNYIFQKFIQAVSTSQHPIVLFLDDLQWADYPSLKLLESVLMTLDFGYLFIIGSYRSNEVDETHPLTRILKELTMRKIDYNSIHIKPLALDAVINLLADTLHKSHEAVYNLAHICHLKSGGNPFFLIHLLNKLYQENLIEFIETKNKWVWNLTKIQEQKITDNVVDLLIEKIKKLTPLAQRTMQLAGCIGNRFDFSVLLQLTKQTPEKLVVTLREILKAEYILSYDKNYFTAKYQFVHDRIQQAAYTMLERNERKLIHTEIARILLQQTEKDKLSEVIFDIANHFNASIKTGKPDFIDKKEEKLIAILNFQATQLAKKSAAYEPMLMYAEYSLKCTHEAMWKKHSKFMLAVYQAIIEALYLNAKTDLVEIYSLNVLQHIKNIFDEIKIIRLRALNYIVQLKYSTAINMIIDTLSRLGTYVPKFPKIYHILKLLIKIRLLLIGKNTEVILNAPNMSNKNKKAALALIDAVYSTTYFYRPELVLFFIGETVASSLRYGNTKESAFSYAGYGYLLCSLGWIEQGYNFGELALNLANKRNEEDARVKCNFANYAFIKHWKDPLHDLLPKMLDNYEKGLDVGNFEFAAYSMLIYCNYSFYAGKRFNDLLTDIQKYRTTIKTLGQTNTANYLHLLELTVHTLTLSSTQFSDVINNNRLIEEKIINQLVVANDMTALFVAFILRLFKGYLLNDHMMATDAIKKLDLYVKSARSSFGVPFFYLYKSLVLLSNYSKSSTKEKIFIRNFLRNTQNKMAIWSKHAPSNHVHRYFLIEAERSRIKGNYEKAVMYYNNAILKAKENGFLHEEAIANELAAKFYLEKKQDKIAKLYMQEACYCYKLLGVKYKLEQLKQSYDNLLEAHNLLEEVTPSISGSILSQSLDIHTISKVSRVISSTIVLPDLLKKVMYIALENAGAEKSYLILNKKSHYYIEAEGNIKKDNTLILKSIKISDAILATSIVNYVIHKKKSVKLDNAPQSKIFAKDIYIINNKPKSILCMPLVNKGKLTGILYLENNVTFGAFTKKHIQTLKLLSSQIAMSLDNAKLYTATQNLNERLIILNQAYERFVPADFLSLLSKKNIIDVELGNQVQEEMSVLFADIRNFTTYSEKMSPQENFNFVNSFLNVMGPIIRKNYGFVDKYIGDAIMALYPREADDALQCALEMQTVLNQFNIDHPDQSPIKLGIGINTGLVMLGTLGEEHRMNVTVISDTVNIAARLQSLTKAYNTPILITEETYKKLKNPARYLIEMVGTVTLKGKSQSTVVYKIDQLPK